MLGLTPRFITAELTMADATPEMAAFNRWRAVREQLFREHPQSPVPADRRATFRAHHFPYDPALRFEVNGFLSDAA